MFTKSRDTLIGILDSVGMSLNKSLDKFYLVKLSLDIMVHLDPATVHPATAHFKYRSLKIHVFCFPKTSLAFIFQLPFKNYNLI